MNGHEDLSNLRLFSLGSNDALAEKIAADLGLKLCGVSLKKFSDGEHYVRLLENVRRTHVVLIQSTAPTLDGSDAHWTVVEFAIDAARRASAAEITVVIPYFGYARQERINEAREPIAASVKARILQMLGATRVVCMDLHAAAIQGFFTIPVDPLYGRPDFIDELEKRFAHQIANSEFMYVSPDVGGAPRARSYVTHTPGQPGLAIMYKHRSGHNMVEEMRLLGDVHDKTCILVDDIIDSGGTMVRAAGVLMESGAKEVHLAAIHGLFSGKACEIIDNSLWIKSVFIGDTIAGRPQPKKAILISMSRLFAEAIRRGVTGESVSIIAPNK